jgi:hypothetical protein
MLKLAANLSNMHCGGHRQPRPARDGWHKYMAMLDIPQDTASTALLFCWHVSERSVLLYC